MTDRKEVEIGWELRPLTLPDATRINNWSYEPPYSMYSFSGGHEDLQDLISENYLGAYDAEGELVGFLCSGGAFLRHGINVLSEQFGVKKFRLAVAAFNERAIQVYLRAGFREDTSFVSMVGIENVSFIQMLREDE